ncbi:MAG: helix-turn-helix domain-containing protein [Planctomycetales bacterium]
MAKKYIELDEAARSLGLSPEELNRLREKGEIRGFADRGNWKFKAEDVEEFGRSRQVDSSPDVPMLGGVAADDDLGRQPTIIRKGDQPGSLAPPTDSDVRLILDDSLTGDEGSGPQAKAPSLSDSDSDVKLVGSDSDSDIRIAPHQSLADSDSDVRILHEDSGVIDAGRDVGTDSDVKLISEDEPRAKRAAGPSDVRPVGAADTGVDIDLAGSDASVLDDSHLGIGSDAGMTIAAKSGISIDPADSGISLASDDSAVSLESPDSSVTLRGTDSGSGRGRQKSADEAASDSSFVLDAREDSGISLAGPSDSGISLLGEDSGFSARKSSDSGLSLGPGSDDELDRTIPMLDSDDELGSQPTLAELPSRRGPKKPAADSEFELEMVGDEEGEDTSVILFDDEEGDDYSATVVKKQAEVPEAYGLAEEEDFAYDDEFADDELEVATDVVGEDDELDADVFDEEDVEGSFVSGGHEGFAVPGGRVAAPVQADWGTGTFVGLLLSTSALVLCGIVTYDLVRSMWGWQEPTAINSTLLEQLRNLLG